MTISAVDRSRQKQRYWNTRKHELLFIISFRWSTPYLKCLKQKLKTPVTSVFYFTYLSLYEGYFLKKFDEIRIVLCVVSVTGDQNETCSNFYSSRYVRNLIGFEDEAFRRHTRTRMTLLITCPPQHFEQRMHEYWNTGNLLGAHLWEIRPENNFRVFSIFRSRAY